MGHMADLSTYLVDLTDLAHDPSVASLWPAVVVIAMIGALVVVALRLWARRRGKWVLIDGSNVMFWKDGAPSLIPLQDTIIAVTKAGLSPAVVFDANAGYKLQDRYLNDSELSQLLKIPRDRVMVAPKGTPADPLLLDASRRFQARIISNDRFRDWQETYPDVLDARPPVRGGYKGGSFWLAL